MMNRISYLKCDHFTFGCHINVTQRRYLYKDTTATNTIQLASCKHYLVHLRVILLPGTMKALTASSEKRRTTLVVPPVT